MAEYLLWSTQTAIFLVLSVAWGQALDLTAAGRWRLICYVPAEFDVNMSGLMQLA